MTNYQLSQQILFEHVLNFQKEKLEILRVFSRWFWVFHSVLLLWGIHSPQTIEFFALTVDVGGSANNPPAWSTQCCACLISWLIFIENLTFYVCSNRSSTSSNSQYFCIIFTIFTQNRDQQKKKFAKRRKKEWKIFLLIFQSDFLASPVNRLRYILSCCYKKRAVEWAT